MKRNEKTGRNKWLSFSEWRKRQTMAAIVDQGLETRDQSPESRVPSSETFQIDIFKGKLYALLNCLFANFFISSPRPKSQNQNQNRTETGRMFSPAG